ncbi:MAG: Rrf2 family transcriptional regulator [Peptoniphilus sp.]|uniref:RrF2 family transcriptional regulator n=1 Tax=Peptoniphilus sp. TaxID=1971214 RepID=UPI0025CE0A7B|nr:Rrf2 family transcriptional regulator [Peptoniphilus sp.]MCI5643751.1 Rrf2 family transcriptional regulator [Peptoniphilus sp.]MDD7351841.1 Rrf2 family transcriptional regulator [Peptoniphilaceae bacterium]MDY3902833.1 Rrf2 family transcriptional regulator [Peptoniphilus sp.]
MRITQETDYAFRIVRYLAENEGTVVGAPQIAENEGVTKRFTLRILRKLNLAGITDAKRGSKGGYYLKKPKEDITLYDILIAIDGPIVINRCLQKDSYCSKNKSGNVGNCKFHGTLAKIQSNIIKMFKDETIDNFI